VSLSPYELLGIAPGAAAKEMRVAYLSLARRWHPDRFQPGPERMWAEDKMIAINQAYAELASEGKHRPDARPPSPQQEQLDHISAMLKDGRVRDARVALCQMTIRSAEWNYLFGATLMRLGEYQKAAIYLSVAANQRPDSELYRAAYQSAQVIGHQKQRPSVSRMADAVIGKTRRVMSGILK